MHRALKSLEEVQPEHEDRGRGHLLSFRFTPRAGKNPHLQTDTEVVARSDPGRSQVNEV